MLGAELCKREYVEVIIVGRTGHESPAFSFYSSARPALGSLCTYWHVNGDLGLEHMENLKMPKSSIDFDHLGLLDFALILNRQTDFDEILRLVAHKTTDMLRAECTYIMMINPSTQETIKTVIRQGNKVSSQSLDSAQRQITGLMMCEPPTFISNDIKQDSRLAKLDALELPVRSAIAILLKTENLDLGSIVVFRSEKAEPFSDSDYLFLCILPGLRRLIYAMLKESKSFLRPM